MKLSLALLCALLACAIGGPALAQVAVLDVRPQTRHDRGDREAAMRP